MSWDLAAGLQLIVSTASVSGVFGYWLGPITVKGGRGKGVFVCSGVGSRGEMRTPVTSAHHLACYPGCLHLCCPVSFKFPKHQGTRLFSSCILSKYSITSHLSVFYLCTFVNPRWVCCFLHVSQEETNLCLFLAEFSGSKADGHGIGMCSRLLFKCKPPHVVTWGISTYWAMLFWYLSWTLGCSENFRLQCCSPQDPFWFKELVLKFSSLLFLLWLRELKKY